MLNNNHPEIDDYGLSCDMSLWAEFNKELLIRRWVVSSRDCWIHRNDDDIPVEGVEVDCGTDRERAMATVALQELIDRGYLNPITYVKTIDD